MIKRYLNFIVEADEVNVDKLETNQSSSSDFIEVKDELMSMIEETAKKQKQEPNSFLKEFLKNPKDVKIDGLVTDSDVFEFYKKWGNDIDEILNKIKFFNERPSDLNAIGLYKYLIIATEKAIVEFLKTK
jgi:hypothetical protein